MNKIPTVGFGTWRLGGEECKKAVLHALKVGYRAIDCADWYENEELIGKAIKESGVPRNEIFITSKLLPEKMVDEKTVYDAALKSLKDLRIDYFDLYLMHWPIPHVMDKTKYKLPENKEKREMTWKVIKKLKEEGKAKHIGVSNFTKRHLDHLFPEEKGEVPYVNQIELHPYIGQDDILEECKRRGIIVTGYCSIGSGDNSLFEEEIVSSIAQKKGKTPAQILLRWSIQKGVTVIPKSRNEKRIEQNLAIFDFELSQEEMENISSLKIKNKKFIPFEPRDMF